MLTVHVHKPAHPQLRGVGGWGVGRQANSASAELRTLLSHSLLFPARPLLSLNQIYSSPAT